MTKTAARKIEAARNRRAKIRTLQVGFSDAQLRKILKTSRSFLASYREMFPGQSDAREVMSVVYVRAEMRRRGLSAS